MRYSTEETLNDPRMNEVSPTQIFNSVRDNLGFLRNWTGNIDDHKAMIEKTFGMYYNAGLPDCQLGDELMKKKDYSGVANLMLKYSCNESIDRRDFDASSGYKSKGFDMSEFQKPKINKTELIRFVTEQSKKIFGNAFVYEKIEGMVRRAIDLAQSQKGGTTTALNILKRFITPNEEIPEAVMDEEMEAYLDSVIDEEITPEVGLESLEEFEDADFDDLEEAAKGKGSAKGIIVKAVKRVMKDKGVEEPEAKSMIFGRLRKLRTKAKGKRKTKKKDEQVVNEISSGGAAPGSFKDTTKQGKDPLETGIYDVSKADSLFFKDLTSDDKEDIADFLKGSAGESNSALIAKFLESDISVEEFCDEINDDIIVDDIIDFLFTEQDEEEEEEEEEVCPECGEDWEDCECEEEEDEQTNEATAGTTRIGVGTGDVVKYQGEDLPVASFQYTDPTKGEFLGRGEGAYPSDFDIPIGSWISHVYSKVDGVYIWAWGEDAETSVEELLSIF